MLCKTIYKENLHFRREMSLGLISGYGSDSDNDNEAEDGNQPERSASYQVIPFHHRVEFNRFVLRFTFQLVSRWRRS